MVHQSPVFTKMFSTAVAVLLMAASIGGNPAWAIVPMDRKTIDKALIYGMQQRKMNLSQLLGPNWVEGDRGALLNIYTPFMLLASKASRLKLSTNPTEEDLEKARKRMRRQVNFYRDPKNKQHTQVKFSVSFFGDNPLFHKSYRATIVGFGRGKDHEVKPRRSVYEEKSRQVASSGDGAYEAINSYYFKLTDIENLQDFHMVLQSPKGPPITFRLNGERLF